MATGDYLYVPPGGLHGFRNEAYEPASILLLFTPGAPREFYFEGLAGVADMTADERREFFVKNDNFFAIVRARAMRAGPRPSRQRGWAAS